MCVVLALLHAVIMLLMELRFVSARIWRVTPTAPLMTRKRKAASRRVQRMTIIAAKLLLMTRNCHNIFMSMWQRWLQKTYTNANANAKYKCYLMRLHATRQVQLSLTANSNWMPEWACANANNIIVWVYGTYHISISSNFDSVDTFILEILWSVFMYIHMYASICYVFVCMYVK